MFLKNIIKRLNKKKKFYINAILDKSTMNKTCIGLFTNHKPVGEGSFCGWYAAEFFLNTTLLAYGFIPRESPIDFKVEFIDDVVEDGTYYDKIAIGTDIWTRTIEARNAEEAIQIFKNQSW